jgi:hypothetical protein
MADLLVGACGFLSLAGEGLLAAAVLRGLFAMGEVERY